MYTRQEMSQLRKDFWTSLGQYLRPLKGADGNTVNWLNYKTGIRQLYFRMDAEDGQARIAIEWQHDDPQLQDEYFRKFLQVRSLLEQATGEAWAWQQHFVDEDGKTISRIGTAIEGVSLFDKKDWPAIISFLKPRIIALDSFWSLVRDAFTD